MGCITKPGYEWQDGLFEAFKENGFNGFIHATTGAGKTIGACKILEEYLEEFPDARIWVAVPNNILLGQWNGVLKDRNLTGVKVIFYGNAVRDLTHYRAGLKADDTPDLLVCDEAHVLNSRTSEVWCQVIEFGIPHVLGLSATPCGADRLVGGTIRRVGYDECAIAPSENNCMVFTPTPEEMAKYNRATDTMRNYTSEYNPRATFYSDPTYASLIMARKRVLHNMGSRFRLALRIVKEHMGERMILFFTTKAQVNKFAKLLDKAMIEYAIQVSGRQEIKDFDAKTGTKNVLLCINMLEQGYDDPTLEVGIMVSYANSTTKNIQKVGRLLRPNEGKIARTYYLIADNTTDIEIVQKKSVIFPPGTVFVRNISEVIK